MDMVWVIGGFVIVAGVLIDMFQTLLYPSGDGWLSSPVMGSMWKISKRLGHPFGAATGSVTMVTVFLVWVVLQVVAWALIYYPYVPSGFSYSPGVDSAQYPDFAEALYLSLVSIATLGFGDIVGVGPWLRFAPPLEALAGFALLTAALTWFAQIEAPLLRRRTLALELRTLSETEAASRLDQWSPSSASHTLRNLARQVAAVRTDFSQHSEQFYFQETDEDMSLAVQLGYAPRMRDAATGSGDDDVRAAGQQLKLALEDLTTMLSRQFVPTDGGVDETLEAYQKEHSA